MDNWVLIKNYQPDTDQKHVTEKTTQLSKQNKLLTLFNGQLCKI